MGTMIGILLAGYARIFSGLLGRQMQVIEIMKLILVITRAFQIVKLSVCPR